MIYCTVYPYYFGPIYKLNRSIICKINKKFVVHNASRPSGTFFMTSISGENLTCKVRTIVAIEITLAVSF